MNSLLISKLLFVHTEEKIQNENELITKAWKKQLKLSPKTECRRGCVITQHKMLTNIQHKI